MPCTRSMRKVTPSVSNTSVASTIDTVNGDTEDMPAGSEYSPAMLLATNVGKNHQLIGFSFPQAYYIRPTYGNVWKWVDTTGNYPLSGHVIRKNMPKGTVTFLGALVKGQALWKTTVPIVSLNKLMGHRVVKRIDGSLLVSFHVVHDYRLVYDVPFSAKIIDVISSWENHDWEENQERRFRIAPGRHCFTLKMVGGTEGLGHIRSHNQPGWSHELNDQFEFCEDTNLTLEMLAPAETELEPRQRRGGDPTATPKERLIGANGQPALLPRRLATNLTRPDLVPSGPSTPLPQADSRPASPQRRPATNATQPTSTVLKNALPTAPVQKPPSPRGSRHASPRRQLSDVLPPGFQVDRLKKCLAGLATTNFPSGNGGCFEQYLVVKADDHDVAAVRELVQLLGAEEEQNNS